MLNRYPYTMGALMVAPVAHLADLRKIDPRSMMEMMELATTSMNILELALKAPAFNIGINQGGAAGAGLKDHIHMHVVPRWGGDANFMTTTGDTRVLAEDVDRMYRRLRRALRKVDART
jgi:ATP adenylyltransferase